MKNKIKNNITLFNAFCSILLQIVTIISGFIIPRLILKTFGSEVNGLVSSLNQLLNYISLLEGGVTSVVMANLYRPIIEKDQQKISSIIKTTEKFYRNIATIFILYSIVLAIIYPFIFNNSFSFPYIFSLTIILSVKLFVQYNFSLSLRTLLNADKKVYIVSLTQILLIAIDTLLFTISIHIFPSIHILKLITAAVYLLQPLIYKHFTNKYFKLDRKAKEDNNLLKSRWDGFAINLASFIHFNTDVTILSIFTNLKTVSVYSVYSLVASGLRQLVVSFSSGIAPSLGHLYAKGDIKELNKKFDLYEYLYFFIIFSLFTIGGLLITPFVMLYTHEIIDVNYNQPIFGVLLLISEAIYVIKSPFVNLAYAANKFKEIKSSAYIETIINIVLSLVLVQKYGLIGVAIGTIIAMIYRAAFHIWFLKKDILYRPIFKFVKKVIIFSLTVLFSIFICKFIFPIASLTVLNWILYAIIYSIIVITLNILVSIIFYKDEFYYMLKYAKGILKK